jgi:hypothetical protein
MRHPPEDLGGLCLTAIEPFARPEWIDSAEPDYRS